MSQKPLNRVGARRTIPGGARQKYFLSPEGRKLLLEKYDGSTKRINELQRALNVPREKVKQWAHDLGLSRSVERWTLEEIDFLKKHIRKMTLIEIAKYLNKTVNTVRRKAHKLELQKSRKEEYTLAELADGLGVGKHTIARWVESGLLRGKKGKTQISFETWQFTGKAIREFVFTHPERIDPRKLEQENWLWLVDILSGEKGVGRLDDDRYGESEEEA